METTEELNARPFLMINKKVLPTHKVPLNAFTDVWIADALPNVICILSTMATGDQMFSWKLMLVSNVREAIGWLP